MSGVLKKVSIFLMLLGSSLAFTIGVNFNDYDGDQISEGPGFGGGPLLVDTSGSVIQRPVVVQRPQQFGSWGYPHGGLIDTYPSQPSTVYEYGNPVQSAFHHSGFQNNVPIIRPPTNTFPSANIFNHHPQTAFDEFNSFGDSFQSSPIQGFDNYPNSGNPPIIRPATNTGFGK